MTSRSVGQDQELNRFAAEIRNRLRTYPAHGLRKNDILRVATASDAAVLVNEMMVRIQKARTTLL